MVRDPAAALSEASLAAKAGADIVEFRIDEFFDPALPEADPERQPREITRLVTESPLPCIVTCRSSKEGGGYSGHEDDRIALYQRLARAEQKGSHPPRYLDIEFGAISDRSVRAQLERIVSPVSGDAPAIFETPSLGEAQTGLILSMHDFQSRPVDLTRRMLAMGEVKSASILKVAYRARSLRDNLELFELLSHADRPTIALAMGEFGLMSRVLAPKFGGFLTFASLRAETVTAPGQPTVSDLLQLFRFHEINRTTKVYGVIGWPVGHSMSPLVHNAILTQYGFNGVYLPLPVAAGETADDAEGSYASFKATVDSLVDDPRLDFSGASVTIPHKENLVKLAKERGWTLDAISAAVGAANTLVVDRNADRLVKSVRVFNTDVDAAIKPLRDAVGALDGKRFAIFGAGGVARGIAYGLKSAGANVTVFNRDPTRATQLAQDLSGILPDRGAVGAAPIGTFPSLDPFDGYINCTPVGMSGGPNPAGLAIPIDSPNTSGNIEAVPVVLETVYNPVETPLIGAAKAKGWRTVDGVTMFVGQASAQSLLWTGQAPPLERMERIVRTKLESKLA